MNKRARQELMEWVLENAEVKSVLQSCPYTGVRLSVQAGPMVKSKPPHVHFDDTIFFGEDGFSKVSWPDVFSEEYGIELAKKKAAARIARKMMLVGASPVAQLKLKRGFK